MTNPDEPDPGRTCSRPDCDTPAGTDVYCPKHLGKIRRALREIVDLVAVIEDYPEYRPSLEQVGGRVLDVIGPIADPAARERRIAELEEIASRGDGPWPAEHLYDHDDTDSPLWILHQWERAWREDANQPTALKATLSRAADYLDGKLGWANTDTTEHGLTEMRSDVMRLRARLQNLLGVRRSDASATPCTNDECDGTRLQPSYGLDEQHDGYRCPTCGRFYTSGEFARAQITHLASDGAARYVKLRDAIQAIPRPEQSVRTWLRHCRVTAYCDIKTHQVWVWWPDMRHQHLEAATRVRKPKKPTYSGAQPAGPQD